MAHKPMLTEGQFDMDPDKDREKLLNAHALAAFDQSKRLVHLRKEASDTRLGWVYRKEREQEAARLEWNIRIEAAKVMRQLENPNG